MLVEIFADYRWTAPRAVGEADRIEEARSAHYEPHAAGDAADALNVIQADAGN